MGSSTRVTLTPRVFDGVYLEAASALDAASPGHLLSALYGSDLSRQARFFGYAALHQGDRGAIGRRLATATGADRAGGLSIDAITARALVTLRASQIVQAVTGAPVPDGFLGMLHRCGGAPLARDPAIYRVAYDLFADPRHRRRAMLLRQTEGSISAAQITAAADLPDVLLRRTVLDRVYDAQSQVEGLKALINRIRLVCDDASDEAIVRSLDGLPPGTNSGRLKKWAQVWAARQVRLHVPDPIPASDRRFRLVLGQELVRLGREFKNCLGERVAQSFLGSAVHYEWQGTEEERAMVSLAPLSGGRWMCDQVGGYRVHRPTTRVIREVRRALHDNGIGMQVAMPGGGPADKTLCYLLDHWLSGEEDDNGEDDVGELERPLGRSAGLFAAIARAKQIAEADSNAAEVDA